MVCRTGPACRTLPEWLAYRVIGGWWPSPPTVSPLLRRTVAKGGVLRAFGIAVLDVTATGIARIVVFGDPAWSRCSDCHGAVTSRSRE